MTDGHSGGVVASGGVGTSRRDLLHLPTLYLAPCGVSSHQKYLPVPTPLSDGTPKSKPRLGPLEAALSTSTHRLGHGVVLAHTQ